MEAEGLMRSEYTELGEAGCHGADTALSKTERRWISFVEGVVEIDARITGPSGEIEPEEVDALPTEIGGTLLEEVAS